MPKPKNSGRKSSIKPGQIYGNYKVLRKSRTIDESSGSKGIKQRRTWLCECKCGKRKSVPDNQLTSGRSTQCRKCKNKDYSVFMHNMLTYVWSNVKKEKIDFKQFWPNANSD